MKHDELCYTICYETFIRRFAREDGYSYIFYVPYLK